MYKWSDEIASRNRSAWLLLVTPDGKIVRFTGASIPGIVAVIGHDYEKDGKWSHTTYRLEIADGVRPIAGHDGFNSCGFAEGLRDAVHFSRPVDRWADVAEALGVSLQEAQRFLREWRPKAADALDEVEKALASVASTTDKKGPEVRAILTSTVCPIDGTYQVLTIDKPESLSGILHYVGHPATRALVEGMGAVKAPSNLFEGLGIGETALVVSIKQGCSSRATQGMTVDQAVTIDDLTFRVMTRIS
jgi:hypothetical protein